MIFLSILLNTERTVRTVTAIDILHLIEGVIEQFTYLVGDPRVAQYREYIQ
jgi:hypothetical protein